jgi:hypothetical protein
MTIKLNRSDIKRYPDARKPLEEASLLVIARAVRRE